MTMEFSNLTIRVLEKLQTEFARINEETEESIQFLEARVEAFDQAVSDLIPMARNNLVTFHTTILDF